MKAKRVSILLAITALSALTLFLVMLCDAEAATEETGTSFPALPDTLAGYKETITIGPDGNARVEIAVVLGQGGFGDLLMPFDFEDGSDFTILSGPAFFGTGTGDQPRPTLMALGRRMLNLHTTADAAAGDTVRVSAHVPGWFDSEASRRPYGVFFLSRRYVNFSAFVLRDFQVVLELAPGMVVHTIDRVVPAYEPKKSPVPPFAISHSGERVTATIKAAMLPPAAESRIDLRIRPARRGLIPLIAGIAFAGLYLLFFRDVLKPKKTE